MSTWRYIRTALVLSPVVLAGCAGNDYGIRAVYGERNADGSKAVASPFKAGKQEFHAGRYGLAVKYFRAAINQEPQSIRALNGLAAAYDKLGRFDLSEQFYGSALALDANAKDTLNNVGYSYFLQRKFDLAETFLREAADDGDKRSFAHANLRLVETALETPTPAPKPPVMTAKARQPVNERSGDEFSPARHVVKLIRTSRSTHVLFTEPLKNLYFEANEKSAADRSAYTVAAYIVRFQPERTLAVPAVLRTVTSVTRPVVKASLTRPAPVRDAGPGPKQDGPPASPRTPDVRPETPLSEISKGVERRWEVARARPIQEQTDHRSQWLNDDGAESKQTTTDFYTPERKDHAEKLAILLPAKIRLIRRTDRRAALQRERGTDLLDFDRKLIHSHRRGSDYVRI